MSLFSTARYLYMYNKIKFNDIMTQMSPIDEAKLDNKTSYTEDINRLKSLNEKLIEENNRLLKENLELKEKICDYKKLFKAAYSTQFLKVFEEFLSDYTEMEEPC